MSPADQRLTGRTALVTGSSRGIGLGIARGLAEAGAEVVLHGRDESRLDAAVLALREGGHTVHGVAGDLSRPEDVEGIAERVEELVGLPDVVVANAGGNPVRPGPIDEIDPAGWEATMAMNLTSTYLTVRAFVPGMKARGSGSIVTMSSTAVRIPHKQSPPAYSVAKAGVEMLTKALAVEVGPYGVRVNGVAPATILTERNVEVIPDEVKGQIAAGYPLTRLGTVEDVAAAVLYLVSDGADWITGTILDVAGGSSTV